MDPPLDPNRTPALPPPQGVVPNFIDPPTIALPLTVGLAVMCGIATVAFAARMFTKIYVMKQVRLEDYLLALAWAICVVFFSYMFAQVPFSLGRNQYNVNLTQMSLFVKYVNLTETFYIIGMYFTKLAILVQLKSIFPSATRDWLYWSFIILMVLLTAYNIANAIVLIAQCVPREKIWNPSVPGVCIDANASTVGSGAFNVIIDTLILILPIYAVFRLKMAVKRKLGICTVFAIGLLTCISSILRLYYSILMVSATDLTHDIVNLCWTAALETTSAILVASFPVMPRLYRFLCGERPAAGSAIKYYSSGRSAFSPSLHSRSGPRKKSNDALDGHSHTIISVNDTGARVSHEWLPLKDDNSRQSGGEGAIASSDQLVHGPIGNAW